MAIYRQATAPAYEAGGLWFDSDDNDKPYYGTGGSWAALNPGSLFTDFSDTDHVQDADVLLGQRGAGGVNYLGSTFVTKNPAGNAGIGTNTPNARLSLFGSAGVALSLLNAATGVSAGAGFQLQVGATSDAYIWNASNGPMIFATNNTERARFDASGNLLIGKSSLGNEVTTDGTIFYKNASGGGMTAYITNGGSGTALAVSTQGDTQLIGFFRSGSNVGSISVTSTATSYNTSSDYRLKDEIAPIEDSGAFIDALKPRQGIWKADGSLFVGFIAHEFAEVSPSSVTGEKDAEDENGNPIYQSMQASSPEVMAHIIAELQSLRARVAQLEAGQ